MPTPKDASRKVATARGAVPTNIDPAVNPELLAEDLVVRGLLKSLSIPGEDCLGAVARNLAEVLSVRYAVVAEFDRAARKARSLAFWSGDCFADGIEWDVAGTPCERVVDGETNLYPAGLQQAFPLDTALVTLGAQSYVGVPLIDLRSGVLGHVFVMDVEPRQPSPRDLGILRIFAALAAAELTRRRLEKSLGESEERLRDLFDEAPIAYVHEDLESRFIRANRAAMRILGITPDQVAGTVGRSLVPDTPDAQRRVREAFESIGRGTDTSGVVLELRRRDNGKPIWLQWWSKPDPSGAYTRTMFLDITDRVLMEHEQVRLQAQNRYLREEIKSAQNFGEIVGESRALLKVLENVGRVAASDLTVLIQGETGTGKELVARAVHDKSPRQQAPFVKVNCAALPAGLVESEFFGHEKGAFTGATSSRRGRFELADGGTIFLDEIGEISPEVQVKLLRVLQEHEFERVGGTQTIKVNVRVIAATNKNLLAEVEAQRFRADLFYRLSVFPILVPPLRERSADIPLLTTFFATQTAAAVGKQIDRIEDATMDRLTRYHWPGNIRELRNVLERAVILMEGKTLSIAEDLLPQGRGSLPKTGVTAPLSLADAEREHIRSVLERTGGVIAGPTGAAKILGMPPSTLRSRMARLGIEG